VVVALVAVSSTEALIDLLLRIGGNIRVGVEGINVVLGGTYEDGHTGEGDTHHAVKVSRVLGKARREVVIGPVLVANLVIKSTLIIDVDCGRSLESRIVEDLEVNVVVHRREGRVVAVRGVGVGLDSDVPLSIALRASGTELSLVSALCLRREDWGGA
jgi:hypothetical protein